MRWNRCCRWLSVVVLALVAKAADGQTARPPSPYSGMEDREIKALSPAEIDSYLAGQGMGLALAAELNGYPGPKHVLELQEALSLSDRQTEQTIDIYDRMLAAAQDLGRQIVHQERVLDALFAEASVTPDSLAAQVELITDLQGRLRVTHLAAHLEMMQVLTSEQTALYVELRGYGAGHPVQLHHSGSRPQDH